MTDPVELAAIDLERSGIEPEYAEEAGFELAENAQEFHPEYRPVSAIYIPYFDPWTSEPVKYLNGTGRKKNFGRIRYLEDVPGQHARNPFKEEKSQRYSQPPDSGVHAYFPPLINEPHVTWADILEDTDESIIIVEGEKKAFKATLEGFTTIGLGGVYNFYTQGAFLPELNKIKWRYRNVYLCFDSDAARNPQIQAAEARLATELSLHRGAILHLVRLPDTKSGAKQGVDDFLVSEGHKEFERLLLSAPKMRKIDTAVISLNEHVAWIEKEGAVYNLRSKEFIRKGDFTNGSVFSSLEVVAPNVKGTGVKRIRVAEEWLKHPHAQRYDLVQFKPESPALVLPTESGGVAVNMWTGWNPKKGDASPFLELHEFLFSNLDQHSELPLKLLAYKAQNPGRKIPLAFILVGSQGCGKSLWAECVREAFSPYTAEISDSVLASQFNGWAEMTLWVVINDATEEVLRKNIARLRSLISDKRVMLNEKFRLARQIDSYSQYIITSNERGAGSFSSDDRRMIVVDCPPKREAGFYHRVARWKNSGGGKRLLHYLLNYDLQGWEPPVNAPMTAEKYMAYTESLTPVQRLAEEIRNSDQHVILLWINAALQWARAAELSNNAALVRHAQEVMDSLQTIQIRPWYTPDELKLMFPSISSQLHSGPSSRFLSAGEVSKELRTAGVAYLINKDDPRGFKWRGGIKQFLVVADTQEWNGARLTQSHFDRLMSEFPRFDELQARRAKKGKRKA